MSKCPILLLFLNELNKSNNINPRKRRKKDKKVTVYDHASELYNEYQEIYFDQYMALPDDKKGNIGNKYVSKNLFLEGCDYEVCDQKIKKNRL